VCDRILLNSCYREKWFRQKSQRNSKGILYSVTFYLLQISCRFWDSMEKYGRAGQATDDSITRCMRFSCWNSMDTDTRVEYVIMFFHGNSGYANAPNCCITRTLRVLVPLPPVQPDEEITGLRCSDHSSSFRFRICVRLWFLFCCCS